MGVVRMGSGRTEPGKTDWQPYDGGDRGIFVKVSTKSAGFVTTPLYFTSLGGNSSHWIVLGAASVYETTPTSFTMYLRWPDAGVLTPAQANGFQWHVCWLGIEP